MIVVVFASVCLRFMFTGSCAMGFGMWICCVLFVAGTVGFDAIGFGLSLLVLCFGYLLVVPILVAVGLILRFGLVYEVFMDTLILLVCCAGFLWCLGCCLWLFILWLFYC